MKNLIITFLLISSVFCYAKDDTLVSKSDFANLKGQVRKADSAKKADSVKKAAAAKVKPTSGNSFGYHVPPGDTGKRCSGDKAIYPDDYIRVKTDTAGLRLAEIKLDTFRLWIDGICFPKIKPLFVNLQDTSLIFQLSYDTASSSPWQLFYAYPNYWTFNHQVTVKIGTLKTEFKTSGKSDPVMKLSTSAFWQVAVAYLLFVLILAVIFRYGKGIIRDVTLYSKNGVKVMNAPTNVANGILNVKEIPCSLARCQFLFWLLIIFLSILHIWGIADELTTPTGTVLLLLGISGGTFYIGRLMDSNNPADPNAPPSPVITPQQCVQEFITNNYKSKGVMIDILTDGKAISLHRLQLVIFTLFLGIYFLWEVLYGLSLPEFSTTMMLLMGISSGTYAGIKTLE